MEVVSVGWAGPEAPRVGSSSGAKGKEPREGCSGMGGPRRWRWRQAVQDPVSKRGCLGLDEEDSFKTTSPGQVCPDLLCARG